MNYILHIGVMIAIYSILTLTLNLLVGVSGLLSLCHGALAGIGAYACTLLMMRCGLGFFAALPVAMLVAGVLAFLISVPSLRLRGDFFVLATLGFQMILSSAMNNMEWLTQGSYGITGVPAPVVMGKSIAIPHRFIWLAATVALLVGLAVWQLMRQPFGRLLKAIRDDELAAVSLGKDVQSVLRRGFVVAAVLAAPAGALLAVYSRYVDPTGFTLDQSMLLLCGVVVGGSGTFRGAIVGALIIVLLPELLRAFHLSDSVAGSLRQVMFGVVLVLVMRLRPQGLAGDYTFER